MKSLKIIIFGLLASLFSLNGAVHDTFRSPAALYSAGEPASTSPSEGRLSKNPSITFSEEQTKELDTLQRAFVEEAKPLWSELRDLRLELRFAVSDPQIQSQVLLDKQRKMSAIQAKLENLRFSYLIKARSVFTKEQLERFPPDCPLKMGTGYGVGRGLGRGFQKGIR